MWAPHRQVGVPCQLSKTGGVPWQFYCLVRSIVTWKMLKITALLHSFFLLHCHPLEEPPHDIQLNGLFWHLVILNIHSGWWGCQQYTQSGKSPFHWPCQQTVMQDHCMCPEYRYIYFATTWLNQPIFSPDSTPNSKVPSFIGWMQLWKKKSEERKLDLMTGVTVDGKLHFVNSEFPFS